MSSLPSAEPVISTDALRVGMFVHLDMSWIAHPFPLSSFKIASDDQIATIRSLGKRQVRWSPDKSDLPDALAAALAPPAPAATVAAPAETPEQIAARERRAVLAAQREALQRCERQYAEATKTCKQTFDLVLKQPGVAREQATALSEALVGKMLDAAELNIRLLAEGAGDKASCHAINVAIVALLMGRTFGLERHDLVDLGVGAMLHDVGKLELPDRFRHRSPDFNTVELDYYQQHVAQGVAMGRRMGLAPGALLVLAQHHEQADGQGFPMKLEVGRMTPASRIVALVNRYDGLCNPAVPSRAMTPHEALSLMFAQGQKQFDTTMLGAFIKMMGVYPPGSSVQLTDDRYALVVSVNSSRPLKPRVLVHQPGVPRDEAPIIDLEQAKGLGIRRSLKPGSLPRESHDYLSPRQRITYFFEPALESKAEAALA